MAAQVEDLGVIATLRPMLARRVAVLAHRLDLLAQHDQAATSVRMREAEAARVAARGQVVDDLMEHLANDPVGTTRALRATPEGCDRLIALWSDLVRCRQLGLNWTMTHVDRAEQLAGHDPRQMAPSDWRILTHVARGRHRLDNTTIDPPDPRDPAEIQAEKDAAYAELDARILAEIESLQTLRDQLAGDLDAEARRAEREALALFDPSPQSTLLRRYEMATERGLYRALRELEKTAPAEPTEPEPRLEVAPASEDPAPMGSFGTTSPTESNRTIMPAFASTWVGHPGDLPQSIGGSYPPIDPHPSFSPPQRTAPVG